MWLSRQGHLCTMNTNLVNMSLLFNDALLIFSSYKLKVWWAIVVWCWFIGMCKHLRIFWTKKTETLHIASYQWVHQNFLLSSGSDGQYGCHGNQFPETRIYYDIQFFNDAYCLVSSEDDGKSNMATMAAILFFTPLSSYIEQPDRLTLYLACWLLV